MEELIHDEARDVFLTIGHFATDITSEALARKATWPFVSVPHFEVKGQEMNVLTNSIMVAFSPLVKEEDRDRWEIYTNYMQGWIQEGVEYSLDHDAESIATTGRHRSLAATDHDETDSVFQVEDLERINPFVHRYNNGTAQEHGK